MRFHRLEITFHRSRYVCKARIHITSLMFAN